MPEIITRAQWGARPPEAIQTVSKSKRSNFMVHHSGANANQSVRAIQDFHMDTRGWSDIGYNFLVRNTGAIYEGRGWDRIGAHCTNWNTSSIGVCLIGDYQTTEPPAVALASIAWLYDQAVHHVGHPLHPMGHRDANHDTDCPGNRLEAWVNAGLPVALHPPLPHDGWHPGAGSRELYLTDPPMQGADVEYVQHFIGPPCGAADGVYGPHTRAGVVWYQTMRGIHVDGRVGRETWRNMGVRATF
jgi:peptidoglycan hydrolase-like protein with peptidoglycan-binding domain